MMEIDYKKYKEEADGYIDEIVKRSDHPMRLVLAGPGTGKSTLFKKICEDNIQNGKVNNIAISFINELVSELKKDLHKLAEVSTLHSFALKELQKTPAKTHRFYMKITDVISRDYEILNKNKIDFSEILCNLVDDSAKLEFYKNRRQYYKHFGPNCSVYTLIKYYEEDNNKIPYFDQLLIDEFQDFNKLETALINLLSSKSKLLIAGDDDQSLYATLRHANPDEIRERYRSIDYIKFKLPFCFRCTETIVNAFNDVVGEAKKKGFLGKRIDDKEYKYYPSKEKDEVSNKNQKIVVKENVFDTSIAFHINKKVKEIFDGGDIKFSVLIITPLPHQAVKIKNDLIKKGFKDVQTSYGNEKDINKSLLDGLRLLIEDQDCNLGWRIVAEQTSSKADLEKAVKESEDGMLSFKDLVDKKAIKSIKSLMSIINNIKAKKPITDKKYTELFEAIGYDRNKITADRLLEEIKDYFPKSDIYKNSPIKITNILGSKGLTKDYVFMVNFDDKYLIGAGKEITDEKVCGFLVALTRAKKGVYVFSQKASTFVEWIDKDLVQKE